MAIHDALSDFSASSAVGILDFGSRLGAVRFFTYLVGIIMQLFGQASSAGGCCPIFHISTLYLSNFSDTPPRIWVLSDFSHIYCGIVMQLFGLAHW